MIGNGAGLVMATLDVVKQAGSRRRELPRRRGRRERRGHGHLADDLSRTGASTAASWSATSSVASRCDLVAKGILEALERVTPRVPIVG